MVRVLKLSIKDIMQRGQIPEIMNFHCDNDIFLQSLCLRYKNVCLLLL